MSKYTKPFNVYIYKSLINRRFMLFEKLNLEAITYFKSLLII